MTHLGVLFFHLLGPGRYSSSSSMGWFSPTFWKQVSNKSCDWVKHNHQPHFEKKTVLVILSFLFCIGSFSHFQWSQQMKTYQTPCLRKAVSRSRLSTSSTTMKDPTQVSWTVETVPGKCMFLCVQCVLSTRVVNALFEEFPSLTVSSSWTSSCLMVCGDGPSTVLVSWPLLLFSSLFSGSCFLMGSDQPQITLICQWPDLLREAPKLFYLLFFRLSLCLSGCTSNSQIHTFTDHCTFTLLWPPFLCQFVLSEGVKYGCNYRVLWVPRVRCFTPQC